MKGPFDKGFGSRLRAARDALALTQEKVAGRIGMSPEHLGRLERGESEPSYQNIIALSRALGVSCDALLGLVPMPQRGQVTSSFVRDLELRYGEISPELRRLLPRLAVLSGRSVEALSEAIDRLVELEREASVPAARKREPAPKK